jgi:hypothetical protein
MSKNRRSRAAAQRLAEQHRQHQEAPGDLSPALAAALGSYVPADADMTAWSCVQPTHDWVMRRAGIKGVESFKKHLGVVAGYLLWRHGRGETIEPPAAFVFSEIDRYYADGLGAMNAKTRNDYRSRLRNVARNVNPGSGAPPKFTTAGHTAVKPGYTADEEAAIRRVALRQRNAGSRRSMCATVGLSAGAGLDAVDFRHLRRSHIDDRGDLGIVVHVPGERPRVTVVRREYEDMVRIGLTGLRSNDLVIGKKEDRTNLTARVIENAEIFEDMPRILVSRLRATWLTWLMSRPVPLQVILTASGLKSARTLADLLPHVPAASDTEHVLRDGSEQ